MVIDLYVSVVWMWVPQEGSEKQVLQSAEFAVTQR